jgi:hypothetical protein
VFPVDSLVVACKSPKQTCYTPHDAARRSREIDEYDVAICRRTQTSCDDDVPRSQGGDLAVDAWVASEVAERDDENRGQRRPA